MAKLSYNTRRKQRGERQSWLLPSTCLTQRRAYFSVFNVEALLLCLFSAGRWSFSSFRVFSTSFWVLALADSWLLYIAKWHERSKLDKQKGPSRNHLIFRTWHASFCKQCKKKWVVRVPAAAGGRVVLLWAQKAEGVWATGRRWTVGVWAGGERRATSTKQRKKIM